MFQVEIIALIFSTKKMLHNCFLKIHLLMMMTMETKGSPPKSYTIYPLQRNQSDYVSV